MKYMIVGSHEIDGVAPGGTVNVVDEKRARMLVRAGHIVPDEQNCSGTTASGGPCSKKAGDDGYCHLHNSEDD